MQHFFEWRSILRHLQRCSKPSLGVFLSMSAYQVAVAFDLRATLFDKALFDIGPRQMHCDQIAVHRFVVPEAEVFHSKPSLGVEVDDLARPSSAVSLQDVLLLAVSSRTGKVRGVFLPLAPL